MSLTPAGTLGNSKGFPLRQSYSRVTPQLLRQASNRKSPLQKIKTRNTTRRLQLIGRTLIHEMIRKMPKNKSVLMPKSCWMPGASFFKTKPINIKFIAFTNPMLDVFPKAKPINLLNSAAKS